VGYPYQLIPQDGKTKKNPQEIILISKLEKSNNLEFTLKRDIFSPDPIKPADPLAKPIKLLPPPPPPVIEKKPEVKIDEKEEIENQIRGSLFYEGYVLKNSKNFALVSMNGEFYAVTTGDMVQERVKIAKIQREAITVEVKSYSFEIQLKGDEENEIQ